MTRSGDPRAGDTMADDRYATWDAAYVLGSLSSSERHEFEAHLQSCPQCRAAVAELTGMPALLGRLDAEDVEALDHPQAATPLPGETLPALLDEVRARRRRTRWVTSVAVAAAAALLAVAVVIAVRPETMGLGLGPGAAPPQAATGLEMTKVAETPINATITVHGYGWGTRIDMACTYGDWGQRDAPPQSLGMVVVSRDGDRSEIATWLGLPGATALPSANTPMQVDEIASVQLVSADSGEVLLERRL